MSVTAVPLHPVKGRHLVYLWLGLALAVVLALALAWHGTAAAVADKGNNEQFLGWHKSQPGVVTTPSGLQYKVVKAGSGPVASDTNIPIVMYRGQLRDGTVFDQSQQPTPMPPSRMTKGFGEGLRLMSKGAVYRFWIRPELAYGDQPPPGAPIPPDALLVFDVVVAEVIPEQVLMQQMMMQQMQGGAGSAGAPASGGGTPPR